MTTDKDTQRVSEAYRDVAKETVPAALDRRVLDLAARAARSRYGLLRAWVRPVAWAATIGLSLAILLEMTWFIDVGMEPQPAAPLTREERAKRDADVMQAKQDDERVTHGVARQAQTDAIAASEPTKPQAKASAATAESFAAKPTVREDPPAASAAAEERAPLREAAESSGLIEPAPGRLRSALSPAEDRPPAPFCNDEARASADSWYECVEALRKRGLTDEADTELEALRETFTDFQEPLAE
jgi:hypothetical protein